MCILRGENIKKRCEKSMKTQIQPTPIVTGEKAKLIEELLKIEPSAETEKGKQKLKDMFDKVQKDK